MPRLDKQLNDQRLAAEFSLENYYNATRDNRVSLIALVASRFDPRDRVLTGFARSFATRDIYRDRKQIDTGWHNGLLSARKIYFFLSLSLSIFFLFREREREGETSERSIIDVWRARGAAEVQ